MKFYNFLVFTTFFECTYKDRIFPYKDRIFASKRKSKKTLILAYFTKRSFQKKKDLFLFLVLVIWDCLGRRELKNELKIRSCLSIWQILVYACREFPQSFFKSILNWKVNSPIMTTMQNGCNYLLFYIKLLVIII